MCMKISIRHGGIFTGAFTIEMIRFQPSEEGKGEETRNSGAVFCGYSLAFTSRYGEDTREKYKDVSNG